MKIELIKQLIKSLDKKGLRKICFELLQMVDDYEIENFNLREENKKIESNNVKERIRADATEIRAESTERLFMIIANAIEKCFDLSTLLEEKEVLNDEKNNSQKVKAC